MNTTPTPTELFARRIAGILGEAAAQAVAKLESIRKEGREAEIRHVEGVWLVHDWSEAKAPQASRA